MWLCGEQMKNDILLVIKDFKAICPRILILTVAAIWFNTVFGNVHAPIEEKNEEKKDHPD